MECLVLMKLPLKSSVLLYLIVHRVTLSCIEIVSDAGRAAVSSLLV